MIKTIIISRGRYDCITTHMMLPDAILAVPKSELQLYPDVKHKVAYPDKIKGLSKLRNWCLDNFGQCCIFDDDITKCWNCCHEKGKDFDNADIPFLIQNTAECCEDAGAAVFGFNQMWDVRMYKAHRPFKLNAWVGGVIGLLDPTIRFDEHNMFKVDIDYCIQNLLIKRKVWIDNRFSFVQKRDNLAGGNALYRTEEAVMREMKYLKVKWGSYVKISKSRSKEKLLLNIQREERIYLTK